MASKRNVSFKRNNKTQANNHTHHNTLSELIEMRFMHVDLDVLWQGARGHWVQNSSAAYFDPPTELWLSVLPRNASSATTGMGM
jgi:hypothetical protein